MLSNSFRHCGRDASLFLSYDTRYTWEWNGVAKALRLDGYPTVGVMAQEAQAMYPQAVSTCAGYLRVDYGLLTRLSL